MLLHFFDNKCPTTKRKFFFTLSRSIAKKNPHTLTLFCVSSSHWMNLLLSNFYITYINIHFYDDIPLSLSLLLNEIKSFILNFFSSSFSLTLASMIMLNDDDDGVWARARVTSRHIIKIEFNQLMKISFVETFFYRRRRCWEISFLSSCELKEKNKNSFTFHWSVLMKQCENLRCD